MRTILYALLTIFIGVAQWMQTGANGYHGELARPHVSKKVVGCPQKLDSDSALAKDSGAKIVPLSLKRQGQRTCLQCKKAKTVLTCQIVLHPRKQESGPNGQRAQERATTRLNINLSRQGSDRAFPVYPPLMRRSI